MSVHDVVMVVYTRLRWILYVSNARPSRHSLDGHRDLQTGSIPIGNPHTRVHGERSGCRPVRIVVGERANRTIPGMVSGGTEHLPSGEGGG